MEIQEEIRRVADSGHIVLVEGIKDKRALEKLGIENVKTLSKRSLVLISEEIANESDTCILLVDLDSEGKKLYSVLRHHLSQMGVKIDNRFRNYLYRKTKLRCIEGLDTYVEKDIHRS